MSKLELSVSSQPCARAWTRSVAAALVLLLGHAACGDDDDAAVVDAAPPDADQSESGHIVFVNPNPTAFTAGEAPDSVANVSAIVNGPVMTTGVPANAAAVWPEVVGCLEEMLAPYNVRVVEEDPGDIDHIEIAVSDDPTDIGSSAGVAGLAELTCEPLPRGIAFAFAGVFGDSTQSSCENLGWLVGHTVGLDNLFHCPDVNTFLNGCGPKSFTDNDSPCGEFEARDCACGGTTQNSHQRMLDFYGPRP